MKAEHVILDVEFKLQKTLIVIMKFFLDIISHHHVLQNYLIFYNCPHKQIHILMA